MSFDVIVDAARARVPAPTDWQQAIDEAGSRPWTLRWLIVQADGVSLHLPAGFASQRELWAALRAVNPLLKIDAS